MNLLHPNAVLEKLSRRSLKAVNLQRRPVDE
jgi:hypothetical protein